MKKVLYKYGIIILKITENHLGMSSCLTFSPDLFTSITYHLESVCFPFNAIVEILY